MKIVIKIVLTNWLNIMTVYICMFISLFISEIAPGISTYKDAIYNTFGSLIVYYLTFWLGFTILIAVLDILLYSINRDPKYTKNKLVLECLLISIPFIYWLVKYNQWIFLAILFAFLIGQYLRRPYIDKILNR